MWSRYLTQNGSRIALLLGQIIVLVVCFSYLSYIYKANILPDKEAKEYFVRVSCVVMSKKLNARDELMKEYRADFLIRYEYNGVQYNRWVSSNGFDTSYSSNQSNQENILAQYEVGETYDCYVNPNNPTLAILILRHNWLSTFPLIVPSVLIIITFYYFLKTIFQFVSAASLRSRTIVREKKTGRKIKNR